MFDWFEKRAPIRTKFRALLIIYTIIAGWIAGAATYAALHAQGINAYLVIGVALAGVAAVIATTLTASRLVCTPYVTTVVRMEALAAGDLHSPVLYRDNKDCVGRMTTAMETFRIKSEAAAECETQRTMALAMGDGLKQLAEGNLTHRIEADLSGAFEQLKYDFNGAVEKLESALSSVSQAANDIHKGAGEIRTASDEMSQRTEQQAASLEQTSAAMDEITTTVRQTAQDAGRTSGIVGEARQDAEEGGEVVRRAVHAMGDIERSSNEISEIIAVIDGIAFQTNLLALNAGVEAARAGDAGKGFAVVASEVRALAQRSAEAAKDVKTRITRSSEQVSVGVNLVSETGKALERIITRIGEISTLVSAIAKSADNQATGLAQINTAVSEMDGVTQQNAAMVEQATASARSLSSEADLLAEAVGRFKVAGAAPQAAARSGAAVHHLQKQAAEVGQRIARSARVRGGAAVAAADDWSEF